VGIYSATSPLIVGFLQSLCTSAKSFLPNMHLLLAVLLSLTSTLTNAASIIAQPPINITSLFAPNRATFNEAITAGAAIVYARYSTAILVEIQATTMMNPTTMPKLLTDVRLIFTVRNQEPYKSALIEMKPRAWGQWLEPRLTIVPTSIMNGALPLPLRMDLVEADQLIKEAGYRGKYWGVNVAWPLSLPAALMQAIYYFEMEGDDPSTLAVATKDRTVLPLPKGVGVSEHVSNQH